MEIAQAKEAVQREDRAAPVMMREIQDGIMRLEALQFDPEIPQEVKSEQGVTGLLSSMYRGLNLMTAIAAKELGRKYRRKPQWEWPDSKPVEIMGDLYPTIAATQWYQIQLSVVVMMPSQPLHPWWNLPILK